MRAPLSVIIPTLNSPNIGPTLASVFEAVAAGLLTEVILADGGTGPEIASLADEIGAKLVVTEPGRGHQLHAGAELARGKWLLFIHSDTVLSPGWAEAARTHMTGTKAGYFRLCFDSDGPSARFVAGWANLRARVFNLPYGDQGLLIPAMLYRKIGGYRDMPLMEDVAMARALRGQLRLINATATTSAARYQVNGWLRRGAHNLVTLALYFLGVAPEKLAKRYQTRQKNG